MSTTGLVNGVLQNLFANVPLAERTAGSEKFRCFYLRNSHTLETLENAVVYISPNTSSPGTEVFIGVDPAGIDGEAATIADEDTPPSGVTFIHSPPPEDQGTGLPLGDLAPGEVIAVWVRRVVNPGTSPTSDSFTLRVQGDPTP